MGERGEGDACRRTGSGLETPLMSAFSHQPFGSPGVEGKPSAPAIEPGASPWHRQTLLIGSHRVDLGRRMVHSATATVRLPPKAISVLLALAAQPGKTVSRDELLENIWKNRFTTPDVICQAVSALRRALNDDDESPQVIETIPRLGYRLMTPVTIAPSDLPAGSEGTPGPDPSPALAATSPAPFRLRGAWMAVVAVLAAVSASGILYSLATFSVAEQRIPRERERWSAGMPRLLTLGPELVYDPRLSPGGHEVLYSAHDGLGSPRRIYLRDMDSERTELVLADPEADLSRPLWSPDRHLIAYRAEYPDGRCEIRVLDRGTARSSAMADCEPDGQLSMDWHPSQSDTVVLSDIQPGQTAQASALKLIRLVGDWRPQPFAYTPPPGAVDWLPRFSPDGRWIAFLRGAIGHSDLHIVSATGGEVRPLTRVRGRILAFDWLPQGDALVFLSEHDGQRVLRWLDIDSGAIRSLLAVQASDLDIGPGDSGAVLLLREMTGRAALVDHDSRPGNAAPHPIGARRGSDLESVPAPDGRRIATVSSRDGRWRIWLYHRDTGSSTALRVPGQGIIRHLQWSPDGNRLLYVLQIQGESALWEWNFRGNSAFRLTPGEYTVTRAIYDQDGLSALMAVRDDGGSRLLRCVRGDTHDTCSMQETGIEAEKLQPSRRGRFYLAAADDPSVLVEYDLAELTRVGLLSLRGKAQVCLDQGRLWHIDQHEERTRLRLEAPSGTLAPIEVEFDGRLLPWSCPSLLADDRTILITALESVVSDLGHLPLHRVAERTGTGWPGLRLLGFGGQQQTFEHAEAPRPAPESIVPPLD